MTWGSSTTGGDSSRVQDQLQDVQTICAAKCGAFAAILKDRSVITWGHPLYGAWCVILDFVHIFSVTLCMCFYMFLLFFVWFIVCFIDLVPHLGQLRSLLEVGIAAVSDISCALSSTSTLLAALSLRS